MIELMVVMAIIGILAATAVVNFGNNDDRDVRTEKDRFISFLREVQNKALAGEISSLTPSGKICGFGAYFANATTVQVYFVETKDDSVSGEKKLDVNCVGNGVSRKKSTNGTSSVSADISGETFVFKNGVKEVQNGELTDVDDVFFLAPHGEVYYKGNPLSTTQAISLTKDGLGVSVPVSIDPSGRIY